MINNISSVDTRLQTMVGKASPSLIGGMRIPPLLTFKTKPAKQKAELRVKKIKRADNIIIPGVIDDDYVDTYEEIVPLQSNVNSSMNFFNATPVTYKTRYLKNCYIIDYIQSPRTRCGLGTEAIKNLAEKAMFDPKAEGRIVTFSSPIIKESSPAIFFYKLGFRFIDPEANEYIKDCLKKNIPDIPVQTGMMYLPRVQLHKLLRYGELF